MAGTCLVGGRCGRGHAWQRGMWGGGMCVVGGCVAGETATSAYFGDVKENTARSVEMSTVVGFIVTLTIHMP